MVFVVEETKGHLVAGEGPGAELHDAGLLVKWEVCHINRTGGLKNRRTDIMSNITQKQNKSACPVKHFFAFVLFA